MIAVGAHDCRYVLWPRIDQKTCLKAIQAAGYEPVVLPMRLEGDQLVTDVQGLQAKLQARCRQRCAHVCMQQRGSMRRGVHEKSGVARPGLEPDPLPLPHPIRLPQELGAEAVACVVTTTSCFAPRAPDDVVAGASLAAGGAAV